MPLAGGEGLWLRSVGSSEAEQASACYMKRPCQRNATKGVRSTPNPCLLWHAKYPKFKNGSKSVDTSRGACSAEVPTDTLLRAARHMKTVSLRSTCRTGTRGKRGGRDFFLRCLPRRHNSTKTKLVATNTQHCSFSLLWWSGTTGRQGSRLRLVKFVR